MNVKWQHNFLASGIANLFTPHSGCYFQGDNTMNTGKRWLQFLLLLMQFILMGIALWPATWIMIHYRNGAETAFKLTGLILLSMIVFNYTYLLALLLLRVIIPKPKEGFFPNNNSSAFNKEAGIFMLNVLLVILRYRPPWAPFFSSLMVNIFPLHYFYRKYFGPDTSSTTMGDTYYAPDPYYLKIGDNVQIGAFCHLVAHFFDQRGLYIRKIEIGDNAVIGARSFVFAGAKIGKNSRVGAFSLVMPNTIIGDNEFWAGIPAQKIKDLNP